MDGGTRRRARLGLAVAVAAACAQSCATLPEPGRVATPGVTLLEIRYREIGVAGLTMETDLLIENPNGFPVKIDRLTYSLSLDGVRFGHGSRRKKLTVGRHGEKRLSVPLRLSFVDMVASAVRAVRGGSGAYRIDGEMILRTSEGDHPRPFRKEGTVNVLRM
ncbi:MAG: LEA type 2 family protein [bacterium]|nr:LEA type 2 family protein [bacterium]